MSEFTEKVIEEARRRDIWLPSGPDTDRMVTVEGTICDAKYHEAEQTLAIRLQLPDESYRGAFLPAKLFKFHGRDFEQTPKEDVDREMHKTTVMFQEARGRKIRLQLYESHMEPQP